MIKCIDVLNDPFPCVLELSLFDQLLFEVALLVVIGHLRVALPEIPLSDHHVYGICCDLVQFLFVRLYDLIRFMPIVVYIFYHSGDRNSSLSQFYVFLAIFGELSIKKIRLHPHFNLLGN